LLSVSLYTERYCLFVAESHQLGSQKEVKWLEAAQEPLCLLTANMQNRRIIDQAFARANCHPTPRLETNSITNLVANVRVMGLASIMPEYFMNVLGPMAGIKAVPLIEPAVAHQVGLVAINREPLSPVLAALIKAAKNFRP
jgi:DNA-binding transcriptional LysR family regulator